MVFCMGKMSQESEPLLAVVPKQEEVFCFVKNKYKNNRRRR